MKPQVTSGLAAYRRRAFCATVGLALLTTGVGATPHAVGAQDNVITITPDGKTKSGDTTKAGAKKDDKQSKKPNDGKPLRIVPKPRQDKKGANQKSAAPAPPPGSSPGGPPITTLPISAPMPNLGGGLPAGTPFAFDYRGADIVNVLKFFAQMSGLTVVADQAVSGNVTIINPKPVTLDEAFKILQSVLNVRGFSAQQNGNVLTITGIDKNIKSSTLVNPGLEDDGTAKLDPRNQVMTQVIPLDNVDAEALSKELAPLISTGASLIGSPGTNSLIMTDTASNIQRFITLVDALDKTSNRTELKVYPLKRAEAGALADIINNLFQKTTTRGKGGPPAPNQPPPQPGVAQPTNGRPAVIAVADQRTNQVLVVASPDNQEQIARDIISRLDDDDSNTLDTKIRKIRYGDAQSVANLVNSVLNNMRLGGGGSQGGSSFQSRAFGYDFYGGGGNNQQQTTTSNDPFGKVTADPRTNTVLISATAERMRKIEELIDQLDVDVPVETTTFVIPLKNAQADDVAYALSQAFSTSQQNNNPFGFFGFFGGGNNNNNNNGRRQRINRRLGNQNNNNNNGFRSANPLARRGTPPGPPNAPDQEAAGDGGDGSAIPQGVQGTMTPDGQFIPNQTEMDANGNPRTRQYYDYYGRRRSGLGTSTSPQYGRGRTGAFSNLLQLQGNAFVTPSPGGDSVIVTTTPDNYKAIMELIAALDVVQRQVMIEVIVAEVTLDQDQKLGVSLGGKLANLFGLTNSAQARINLPSAGSDPAFAPLATGAQFVISGAKYDALLQALSADNKVKVLSTPRIFTSNNQEADIEIVTSIPYVTSQQTGSFINTNVSNEIKFAEVGFILNVVPRITRQGLVSIDVQQDASDLLRYDIVGTGVSALRVPVVNDRYADTSVTVQDGETIVIGGLIRDSRAININKIPLISEIPLIGQFFRSRQTTRNKVELMIFMTPHVVNSVEEARELTRKQGSLILPQIPDLGKQQPNLLPNDSKVEKKGKKKEEKAGPSGNTTTDSNAPPPGSTQN